MTVNRISFGFLDFTFTPLKTKEKKKQNQTHLIYLHDEWLHSNTFNYYNEKFARQMQKRGKKKLIAKMRTKCNINDNIRENNLK